MARVVNLRTRRKQKARDAKRDETASAGPAPGVSRLEQARAEAENRLLGQRLEGHRLDNQEPDSDTDAG